MLLTWIAWTTVARPSTVSGALARIRQLDEARQAVHAALDSMGGLAAIRALRRVRVDGAGYAAGDGDPPALTVFQFSETRDDRQPRLVQDVAVLVRPGVSHRSVRTLTLTAGGVRVEAGGVVQLRDGRALDDWFTEAPENVLLAALSAPDLGGDSASAIHFTWQGRLVRVRFAASSGAITSVELEGARTVYSRWRRTTGIDYPRQWTVMRNGAPIEEFTADRVTLTRE